MRVIMKMKATGIVRKIDNLGRVVIPREIRRTMRISQGDPLEIFTSENQIIFQKYSGIGNMAAIVKDILAGMHRTYKMPVIACDQEKVVAAKGTGTKEIVNRWITPDLLEIMERRRVYAYDGNSDTPCLPIEGVERYAVACAPIIVSGDIAGAILYLSVDKTQISPASETQIALVRFSAAYLGEQLSD